MSSEAANICRTEGNARQTTPEDSDRRGAPGAAQIVAAARLLNRPAGTAFPGLTFSPSRGGQVVSGGEKGRQYPKTGAVRPWRRALGRRLGHGQSPAG